MKKDISKIHYPEFPSLEGTNIGKLSQTQYLSSVIRVHIKMVQSLFGQIPEFKAMSEGARRTLTRKELLMNSGNKFLKTCLFIQIIHIK